ncbi:transport and Golgi organization protein 1 homolog isoform X1 [Camelus dromedarius]|uniref:transport and Golgi organization protein 1 homolog isoform X1 n=1 Tax=Camelus dromedarius TaxID=9838 RepID=UPI0031199E5B
MPGADFSPAVMVLGGLPLQFSALKTCCLVQPPSLAALASSPGALAAASGSALPALPCTEGKKKMQDHHAASGSLKEREEDGFQRQVKKVRVLDEISGQRSMDTEGKVDMNGCELVGKQQLLAAKEEAKLAEEETRWYKIRLEECHGQMREAEIIWRHQVTLAEKKAQDSSLRAQELEREISELRRENSDLRRENSDLRREKSSELRREVAHLKQRLNAICRWRQAEEYMRQEPTPGGPYRLQPPLRGKERTVKCGSSISAAGAAQWAAFPHG